MRQYGSLIIILMEMGQVTICPSDLISAAMLANLIQDGKYHFLKNKTIMPGFRARGDVFVGNLFSLYPPFVGMSHR
jgi:hypothetical protein